MTTAQKAQELQAVIWNGSLPLEIRLAPSECRVYDQADPYLASCFQSIQGPFHEDANLLHQVQLPRLSYLQILLPRLHAFFLPSLIDPETIPYDGWFAFEDVPLKWQYPLGLLYDLFSGAAPYQAHTQESNDENTAEIDNNQLPWRLTVHFADWPEQTLVRPDAEGRVLHDAFINAVKEADFLRNGTAKGIMSLSKEDSTTLWNAVQERKPIRLLSAHAND